MADNLLKIKDITAVEEKLKEKIENISESRLFIAEEKLKEHLTENEILELLAKGIIEDETLL